MDQKYDYMEDGEKYAWKLINDGKLTREQLSDIRASFRFFDKNGDGSISSEELETVMSYFGQETGQHSVIEMMKQVDSDGDGSIDFKEFVMMMSEAYYSSTGSHDANNLKTQKFTEATYRQAFQIFDKDGDGFINASELMTLMKSLGDDLTQAEIDDMIKEADLNGDNKVDFKEFMQILKE